MRTPSYPGGVQWFTLLTLVLATLLASCNLFGTDDDEQSDSNPTQDNSTITDQFDQEQIDPVQGTKTALAPSEMSGNWYVAEEWEIEYGTWEGTDTEGDNYVVIDDNTIVSYYYDPDEIDATGSDCYNTETMTYSLDGNKLVGENLSGTETDEYGTYTVTTTYAKSGGKLIVKILAEDTYTEAEAGESGTEEYTEEMTMTFVSFSGSLPPSSWPQEICATDSWISGSSSEEPVQSGSAGSDNVAKALASPIAGTWKLESEAYKESGIFSWHETKTQPDQVFVVTGETITSYENDEYDNCTHVNAMMPYTLSGMDIKGDDFEGSESEGSDGNYTWKTSVYKSGGDYYVEQVETGTYTDNSSTGTETGDETEKVIYLIKPYDGTVPPESFPATECSDSDDSYSSSDQVSYPELAVAKQKARIHAAHVRNNFFTRGFAKQ